MNERRLMRLTLAILIVLGGAACSSASDDGGLGQKETEVDWVNYDPSVRTRIDDMAAARDCDGLQKEFDTAGANGVAQRNRTGDGNSDLMDYINDKLTEASCET